MGSYDLPHPGRSALAFGALAVAALALDADPRLPWVVGAVAALLFAAAGAIRTVREARELATVRRVADRQIVEAPSSHATSELIRWRSHELTSRAARDALVREIGAVLRAIDPRYLPSASPLQRPAARACRPQFETLAARLASERPVCARGILLAQLLLRDGSSPLYSHGAPGGLLPRELRRVLGALEP